MKNNNKNIYFSIVVLSYSLSILLGKMLEPELLVLFSTLSGVLLIIYSIKMSANILSLSTMTVAFYLLYGVSGPISVVFGSKFPTIFTQDYRIPEFMFYFNLAGIALSIGIFSSNTIIKNSDIQTAKSRITEKMNVNTKKLLISSFILMLTGSLFEIINIYRAGGIPLLLTGKAKVQAALSRMFLTLPSEQLILLAFALLFLFVGYYRTQKNIPPSKVAAVIILIIVVSVPFLSVRLFLGSRGVLLAILMIVFVGFYYFEPLKKLKLSLIIFLSIIYFFMGFLFVNRNIIPRLFTNPDEFWERALTKNKIISSLNPGANEFGAAFGNFNEFYIKYETEFEKKLGITYIEGLTVPIPSFIYPKDKPKQITYVFRDEFFPQEAERSSTAGTGFSSLLEAYINFGGVGIFLVYFLLGLLTHYFEMKGRHNGFASTLLYLVLFEQSRSFHRTSFGAFFSTFAIYLILVVILLLGMSLVDKLSEKSSIKKYELY